MLSEQLREAKSRAQSVKIEEIEGNEENLLQLFKAHTQLEKSHRAYSKQSRRKVRSICLPITKEEFEESLRIYENMNVAIKKILHEKIPPESHELAFKALKVLSKYNEYTGFEDYETYSLEDYCASSKSSDPSEALSEMFTILRIREESFNRNIMSLTALIPNTFGLLPKTCERLKGVKLDFQKRYQEERGIIFEKGAVHFTPSHSEVRTPLRAENPRKREGEVLAEVPLNKIKK